MAVIASRALGNAVVRNRVKRHFREIFRRHGLGLGSGFDILFLPRKAHRVGFTELERRFLQWQEQSEIS